MMAEPAGRWRTLEHTADLAIEVEAPTLPELFVTAARGLTGLLVGAEEGGGSAIGTDPAVDGDLAADARVWRELSLTAADTPALLVDWLRELLWIQSSEDLRFATAEFDRLDEDRLVARVGFEPLPDRSAIERELKGVTYHDLELARLDDGWYARVIFDV